MRKRMDLFHYDRFDAGFPAHTKNHSCIQFESKMDWARIYRKSMIRLKQTTTSNESKSKYKAWWAVHCSISSAFKYRNKMKNGFISRREGVRARKKEKEDKMRKWENEKRHKFYSIFITLWIAWCKNILPFLCAELRAVTEKKGCKHSNSNRPKSQQRKWNPSGKQQWKALFGFWHNQWQTYNMRQSAPHFQ